MKWSIPAKTFLLGEYAAIAEASAILLTTTPCFELELTETEGLSGIHPDSPAGIWWRQQNNVIGHPPSYHTKCSLGAAQRNPGSVAQNSRVTLRSTQATFNQDSNISLKQILIRSGADLLQNSSGKGIAWHDPYGGRGGLGASSAQFLASYLASCYLQAIDPKMETMLTAYYQSSWSGKGLRPSGYDVIAQSQQGCVYINKQKKLLQTYAWPFKDLAFFLLHTGVKLATHHHLQDTNLPKPIDKLSAIVDTAQQAFEQADSELLISCINSYHEKLTELHLVADHSLKLIQQFKTYPEVLAVKGCGALGADILLLVCSSDDAFCLSDKLLHEHRTVLATENFLHQSKSSLIQDCRFSI